MFTISSPGHTTMRMPLLNIVRHASKLRQVFFELLSRLTCATDGHAYGGSPVHAPIAHMQSVRISKHAWSQRMAVETTKKFSSTSSTTLTSLSYCMVILTVHQGMGFPTNPSQKSLSLHLPLQEGGSVLRVQSEYQSYSCKTGNPFMEDILIGNEEDMSALKKENSC